MRFVATKGADHFAWPMSVVGDNSFLRSIMGLGRGISPYTEPLNRSKTLCFTGGPPGSRSRHLGIKGTFRWLVRVELVENSTCFQGIRAVACLPGNAV